MELLQLDRACCRDTGEEAAISAANPITAMSLEFIAHLQNTLYYNQVIQENRKK